MLLTQSYIVAKNTYLEAVRSKILHSVLLFGVFIIGISAVFGSVSIGETFRVIKSFGYTIISFSSVICVIISGVSLFQKEIAQKTIFNILAKPVSRTTYIVGKFFGLWCTGIVLSSLMMLLLLLFLINFEGKFDFLGFQALIFIFLEIGIISAVTILFSSVSVTPVLPGLFTFAVYLAGKSIFYLKAFSEKTETSVGSQESIENLIAQSPFVIKLVKVFYVVLPDLHLLTPYDKLVYGEVIQQGVVLNSVLYSFSYMLITLFISSIFFKQRDF